MWGALSDERTGLSFARVTAVVVSLLLVCTIYILHVIKRMHVLVRMYKCMYIQHIQSKRFSVSLINLRHGPRRKNRFPIVVEAC
jgi:hypothetical protein